MSLSVDGVGWTKKAIERCEERRRPFFPRARHILTMIPVVLRFMVFRLREWWHGRGVFIDMLNQMHHDEFTGVPLGGIGSGTIGTDIRMGFNSFSLLPGVKEKHVRRIKHDQFFMKLTTSKGAEIRGLSLDAMAAPILEYRGLYPRFWCSLNFPDLQIKLRVEAFSPVIPHNYKDSSLPVACFRWEAVNYSAEDVRIEIYFSFRNGTGEKSWAKESVCVASIFEGREGASGIELQHTVRGMPVTYGIYARNDSQLNLCSFDPTTSDFPVPLRQQDLSFNKSRELGICLGQSIELPRSGLRSVDFVLVWHMPVVRFAGARSFKRRYTRFFGCSSDAVSEIGTYALENFDKWRAEIENFQAPIVANPLLPDWFKSALLNELYYISDGSTLWFEYDDEWSSQEPLMSELTSRHLREFGRFGYSESWEYLMTNTYDVHFYASWALHELWPQLELSVQLDFADQFSRTDSTKLNVLYGGEDSVRKQTGRVPHDLGYPLGEPWLEINAYSLHDTNDWKDLNLKFVLLSYRDYRCLIKPGKYTNKEKFELLNFFYDKCVEIIERGLREWDVDDDDLIENNGHPDQTYDIWSMTRTSAYCGSLWLAAVECVRRMAAELGIEADTRRYARIGQTAAKSFVSKLWNGEFFSFDEEPRNKHVSMADQLCGFWFLSLVDEELCTDILGQNGAELMHKAMAAIHKYNLKSVQDGRLGPVNGFRVPGEIDLASIQSEEIWPGIAYALTSLFLLEGRTREGLDFAKGIYETTWLRLGLQYQTPEAIYPAKFYRAIGYLRPLSIIGVLRVLKSEK